MKRVIVLCLAALFAVTLLAIGDAAAQAPKTEKPAAKGGVDKPADKAEKSDAAGAKTKKSPIDINTASAEELQTIPGIGEAYSKKIVENRPYKRKDEVVKKAGVPQATYDKVKDQIIAKQSAAGKKDDKKSDGKPAAATGAKPADKKP